MDHKIQGSKMVEAYKSADRIQKSNWSTLREDSGDAAQGEKLIDSYVPLDRDYSRQERAAQQKQLHDMMRTIHEERASR